MYLKKFLLRNDDAGADGGGGAAVVDPPADKGGAPAGAAGADGAAGAAAAAKGGAPADDGKGKPADDKGGKADDKGGKPPEPKGWVPDDWREKAARGDAKVAQRLARYASPEAVVDALVAAQNKISAGELKPVLGKNATADDIKAYREAHGIPEEHTKYDLKDVKTDLIKPDHLDLILKHAHETNQTPDQVKSTVGAVKNILENMQAERAEKDAGDMVTNEDALRTEWGGDFRRNINLIHGLLDGQADEALKESFLSARLPDGTLVGNHPGFMRMMLGLALVQNPTGTVVPGAGANLDGGIKEELEKIQNTMKTNRTAYNKDTKMQDRFRELTDAAIKRGLMDENGNWKK